MSAIAGGAAPSRDFKQATFEALFNPGAKKLRRLFGYDIIPEAARIAACLIYGDCGRPPAFLGALSVRGPQLEDQNANQSREFWYETLIPTFARDAAVGDLKEPYRTIRCMELLADAALECFLPSVRAASNQVESPHEPAQDQKVILDKLTRAQRNAWSQYTTAERRIGDKITDRDAWNWLEENQSNLATELNILLPDQFETWARHLRAARAAFDARKNNRRPGRTGRSIQHPE